MFWRATILGLVLISMILLICPRVATSRPSDSTGPHVEAAEPWGPDTLIKPEDSSKILSKVSAGKTLLIHVGFPSLFRSSHITGSKYVGPAVTAEGVENLKEEVRTLPRDTEIVLYCGCCPWSDCPNIRPAYLALSKLGYKNVKVLYLPNNLLQDWVQRGFPIEKRVGN